MARPISWMSRTHGHWDYRGPWALSTLVYQARARVRQAGLFDGTPATAAVLDVCRHIYATDGVVFTFTRDIGAHTGGWWKNPDYERCEHLSLSFRDPETSESAPHNHRQAKAWCEAFFGDFTRWLWVEPPKSDLGKKLDVWHYRLFCDPAWNPILPRGEVYTREFTEAGWKSWSELHADEAAELAAVNE